MAVETIGKTQPTFNPTQTNPNKPSTALQPLFNQPSTRSNVPWAEEAGMKGWRERAADIFAKHGKIAANMKSAQGLTLRIFRTPIVVHWKTLPWHAIHAWTSRTRA